MHHSEYNFIINVRCYCSWLKVAVQYYNFSHPNTTCWNGSIYSDVQRWIFNFSHMREFVSLFEWWENLHWQQYATNRFSGEDDSVMIVEKWTENDCKHPLTHHNQLKIRMRIFRITGRIKLKVFSSTSPEKPPKQNILNYEQNIPSSLVDTFP